MEEVLDRGEYPTIRRAVRRYTIMMRLHHMLLRVRRNLEWVAHRMCVCVCGGGGGTRLMTACACVDAFVSARSVLSEFEPMKELDSAAVMVCLQAWAA